MNAELYRRAREIFVRAIELEPASRAPFVDAQCSQEEALRAEVTSLLAAHEGARGFDSLPRAPRPIPALEATRFPERIGSYRIQGVLGEGGMGVVYLAEQESPRRTVALKVLHPGVASAARIRRLEHEAEILGRLHHPGIAQVYEAGSADVGSGSQPYLAMELVEGRPLVEHANAAGLGLRARVELLVEVCRAVHHAHERGIVHRDLKPANILVDEHGTPKVLDFGIARATAEDVRERSQITGVGEVLGTLPYMSPEQVEGDRERTDRRTDVYALGVIGYELLSGRLPIEVASRSLPEAARAIREDEPPLLGTLGRALRGDVETIFAKALEKDPERRYSSALELESDLERWLAQEPIVARPPSTMYQLAKFARRNRVLVAGVAGVFAALVVGIVGTAWQAFRATAEAERAVHAQGEAEAAQKAAALETERALKAENEARIEAKRTSSTYKFIEDTLRSADPQQLGREVTVVDVLDGMASRVGSEFASDSGAEANLRYTIGLTYYTLGRVREAEVNLRRSLDLHRELYGPESVEAGALEYLLGVAAMSVGKLEESVDLLRLAREHNQLEVDEQTALNNLATDRHLAAVLTRLGRLDEAALTLREALTTDEPTLGASSPLRGALLGQLGPILRMQGKLDDAAETLERAAAIQRAALGREDPDTLFCEGELASVRLLQERYDDAQTLCEHVLEASLRVLGEENLNTLTAMENLADLYAKIGRRDEAVSMFERALEIRQRALGANHPNTLVTKLSLVQNLHRQGREVEMERLFEELVRAIPNVVGGESVQTVDVRSKLAGVRLAQRRGSDAESLEREALRIARDQLVLGPTQCAVYEERLGECLLRQDRFEEAQQSLQASDQVFAASFGDSDPRTRRGIELLVELYGKWNKPEKEAEYASRLGSDR